MARINLYIVGYPIETTILCEWDGPVKNGSVTDHKSDRWIMREWPMMLGLIGTLVSAIQYFRSIGFSILWCYSAHHEDMR